MVEDAFRKLLKQPGIYFEAGPSKWETIKRHLAAALQGSDYRGDSLVLLSQNNVLLHKALNGAWHYPVDNSGNVRKHAKPEKDINSHPGDCFGNAVSVLLPSVDARVNLGSYKQAAARTKRRVQSYVAGGGRAA